MPAHRRAARSRHLKAALLAGAGRGAPVTAAALSATPGWLGQAHPAAADPAAGGSAAAGTSPPGPVPGSGGSAVALNASAIGALAQSGAGSALPAPVVAAAAAALAALLILGVPAVRRAVGPGSGPGRRR